MQTSFQVTVDAPCAQKWEEMEISGQGRFCENCSNTVIDFAKMTDYEFQNYLSSNNKFCGRFRDDQLGRPISKYQFSKSKLLKLPSKLIAFLFAFLSLKGNYVQASPKSSQLVLSDCSFGDRSPKKIEVKGKILDDLGDEVEGASIKFDGKLVAESDSEGNYEFSIENVTSRTHLISFEKKGLRRTTQSFHPSAESHTYNIKLYALSRLTYRGGTMGVPVMSIISERQLNGLEQDRNGSLNEEIQSSLNELAGELRANPNASIILEIGYQNKSEFKKNKNLLDKLIEYLVDAQGIDRERLQARLSDDPSKRKILKIRNNQHGHFY